MSAAIQSALNNLNQSINKLASAVETKEQAYEGQQRELFAAQAALNDNAGSLDGQVIDQAVLARTLDKAIGRVEQLLQEEV